MSAPVPAARGVGDGKKGDLVEHNWALAFRFVAFGGWTIFGGGISGKIIKGAALLIVGVTPVGVGVLVATFTLEWLVGELLENAAFKLGEQITSGGMDGVKQGSNDVFINKQPASRGGKDGDEVICCPGRKILGGSKWVNMNRKPAARYDDWLDHSGKIKTGSLDTLIGGPTVEEPEKWEYQDWFKWANIARELAPGAIAEGVRSGLKAGGRQLLTNQDTAKNAYQYGLDKLWEQVK